MGASSGQASPLNDTTMSQISIAGSQFLHSPVPATVAAQAASIAVSAAGVGITARGDSGGSLDTAALGSTLNRGVVASAMGRSQDLTGVEQLTRSPLGGASDGGYSEAGSRYDSLRVDGPGQSGGGGEGGGGGGAAAAAASASASAALARDRQEGKRPGVAMEPPTPNSAAGSRFPDSPSSNTTSISRLAGSPTPGNVGASGAYTARSIASSIRSSMNSSFFRSAGSSARSHRSGASSQGKVSSASGSSWDEEDLQNMGARWLSDRAYNQQFDEK